MNRILLMLSFLLLSLSVKAGFGFTGETTVVPYKPYSYFWANYVGIDSAPSTYATYELKVTVTNGKIMDSSGNYTLTSAMIEEGTIFNVLWECASTGRIDLYHNDKVALSHHITIESCNMSVSNRIFTSSDNSFEWAYITMQDITVKSGAGLTVHGYQSVTIRPGFIAETGSKVVIKSGIPTTPVSPYSTFAKK